MIIHGFRWLFIPFGITFLCSPALHAEVLILANRTAEEIHFTFDTGREKRQVSLSAGSLASFQLRRATFLYLDRAPSRRYLLRPNSVQVFLNDGKNVQLQEIELLPPQPTLEGNAPVLPERAPLHEVTVKILVDDKEPAQRNLWEKRLRERLIAASAVLEEQCRVRLRIVAIQTWTTPDAEATLEEVFADFERTVRPAPAQVAIGFTSNRRIATQPAHLGGTRGPLHSHIMVREWMPRTEPERLEVLLHELGHFLGAAHSPEAGSIMRPKLGDGLQTARSAVLAFDPVNALAMNLIVADLRTKSVRGVSDLPPTTRQRLRLLYTTLAKIQPDDPVAARLADRMEEPAAKTVAKVSPLAEATRVLLAALVRTARASKEKHLSGDALTEAYMRAIAQAAEEVPVALRPKAFLLALALGLDDSTVLRQHPVTAEFCREAETAEERRQRLAVLGAPTMRQRRDWTQHFAISAGLTALTGPTMAEAAGVLKELKDAKPGGSGFSFGDLAADLAGIAFAQRVLDDSPEILPRLADSFRVVDCMPAAADLPEGLAQKDFAALVGSISDPRYLARKEEIRRRIRDLPLHRSSAAKP